MNDIRYPIGQFIPVTNLSTAQRHLIIDEIANIPKRLRDSIARLREEQLILTYRTNGWNIKQIIHHLADAEMNAFIRFRKGLTEENAISASFNEQMWAELADYSENSIETSIVIIEALHSRFVTILYSMDESQYYRTVTSETHGLMTLDIAMQRFLWHANHHIGHILLARASINH